MSTRASDARALFAARLREELRADEDGDHAVSDDRRAYREAACLLTHFDPVLLRRPGEEHTSGGAVLELLDDCTTMGTNEQAVWSLKADVRDETLSSLAGPEAARHALESNLDQFGGEWGPENVCLACLSGSPPPTAGQNVYELGDTLQAVLWLSRVPGVTGLPDTAELQHALERARLLQPLERLLRQPFQGRARELRELREYAEIATGPAPAAGDTTGPTPPTGDTAGPGPSGPAPASAPDPARPPALFRAPVPPLIIHGPGGMGKSTLLAKFLLEGRDDRTPGFPFAYIDFERPTLSIHEPLTLIAEAARQLGIQYPTHHDELDALSDECQQAARSQREGQDRVTQLHGLATTRSYLGRSSSQEFQMLATERETGLIRRMADVLVRAVADAGQRDPPFVMVIDSFEEAQYRGSPMMSRMWAIHTALQEVYPRLRIVVSGRAPVDEHPARTMQPREIELHELDPESAIGVLASCGVTDPDLARVLVDRVGGHPLSLKLAARAAILAAGEGESTGELIRSLPARREDFFRRVDQMLVQGILYDRILNHIANRDVRRLARPGLVLRVITPEIIKDVLAEPCGLRVDTLDDARSAFDELSRLDLVEPAGPDAVRHRGDVRAIMLRLPGSDRTDVMRSVERRAVTYYATRDGLEARAEEIYHRLRLGENPRSVEERWLPGVERFLTGAQQDMTPRAAGLLMAKLGGGASESVLEGADQEDWERITAREIEDLLAQGFGEAALLRLGERRPWTPCSPLHPLLAETLHRLGRSAEARRTASEAIAGARSAGCAERRLELLLLAARLAEEAGDLTGAGHDLREAEDLAVGLGQDLEAMGALLARAHLATGSEVPDAEADSRLVEGLRRLPDAVLADQPALVRAVASQIYAQDPKALDHALEVVGLPADDAALETLGAAVRRAASRQPRLLGTLMDILGDAAGPSDERAEPREAAAPSSTTEILRLARDRGTLDVLARRLLAVHDESGEIVAGVAAAMGAGATGRASARTAGSTGSTGSTGAASPGRDSRDGDPRSRAPRPGAPPRDDSEGKGRVRPVRP